jgi:histidinol phosphatase-like PHP family hydrolase
MTSSAADPAGTPWQPLDCHAHTTLSDGSLAPSALVTMVRGRGARPGIADHISRDVMSAVRTVAEVDAYLTEIEALPVARGGEFCWHDALWRELPPHLVARFTHRLGSLHAIHLPGGGLVHMFQRGFPAGLTLDAYMDAHVADLERFAAEMPVDILSHPTLLPLGLRRLPLEELWTEEREERAVEALYRAGTAFEISNRYRPHERFVRRAVDRGVRISLGSDGHTPEQVGDLAFPLDLARRVGVRDEDLYDPAVHGSKTQGVDARA